GEVAGFVGDGGMGLAAALLHEDRFGWFQRRSREQAIVETMGEAVAWLRERLGPEMGGWTWGKLHRLVMQHPLSGRGDLAALLDRGGAEVPGDGVTVCSTVAVADGLCHFGAGYRMIADLASTPPELRAVDAPGESGHPGSPHYTDGLQP